MKKLQQNAKTYSSKYVFIRKKIDFSFLFLKLFLLTFSKIKIVTLCLRIVKCKLNEKESFCQWLLRYVA